MSASIISITKVLVYFHFRRTIEPLFTEEERRWAHDYVYNGFVHCLEQKIWFSLFIKQRQHGWNVGQGNSRPCLNILLFGNKAMEKDALIAKTTCPFRGLTGFNMAILLGKQLQDGIMEFSIFYSYKMFFSCATWWVIFPYRDCHIC